MVTLANKYRPKTWQEVTEQSFTSIILQQQLESNEIKNAYLFVGPAGTGKTTCARIFANAINNGLGNPIEMDAASNSSVEDVRRIMLQAQTKSLDSEYKVFIIDECHSLSTAGWQVFLKLIEEPPAKSIFIFVTTEAKKIPKTIISRVQRFDFSRISTQGICDRLNTVLCNEFNIYLGDDGEEAVEYIAKLADGGMRDALTMLDKCLAYSTTLTLENVVKCLGTVDYDVMTKLTDAWLGTDFLTMFNTIESIYNSGKDIKQFIRQYIQFILDIMKLHIGCDKQYVTIPDMPVYMDWVKEYYKTISQDYDYDPTKDLLDKLVTLNSEIKYSSTPKYDLEAALLV